MRTKIIFLTVVLSCFIPFSVLPVFGAFPLRIMTENFPPFNYMEDGVLKGPSVEIVEAILNDLQCDLPIDVLPWARAYKIIQEQDQQVLFSMARTPQREELFQWVGPLVKYDVYLYKSKEAPLPVTTLEEAKRFLIGVKNDTAGHRFLKDQGFSKIHVDYSSGKYPLPRMLLEKRIDLWLMGEISMPYIMEMEGYDAGAVEPVVKISSQELYIAFSRFTPEKIVAQWQKSLESLKKQGIYQQIMQRYRGKQ